jgi:hypothetical protein
MVEGYQHRDGGQVNLMRVKGTASTLQGSHHHESCGAILELDLVLSFHGIGCSRIAQAL